MSIDKFRFVSPGVQIAEIDQSRRTRTAAEPGPLIIGRFQRGPTMRPTKVDSLSELTEIFGDAITGRESGDISRNGNYSAPSYAAFAANAWLASQGGATILRLVGKDAGANATAGSGEAGWGAGASATAAGKGGAWGLWIVPSASTIGSSTPVTGVLGAIFYCATNTGVAISGTVGETSTAAQSACRYFKSTDGNYKAIVATNSDSSSSIASPYDEEASFNFNPQSSRFIRKVFNTTPYNTNTNVIPVSSDESKNYWLGETFEDDVARVLTGADDSYIFSAPLVSGSDFYSDHTYEAQPSKTGWVIAQDTSSDAASYLAANMQKLFRFVSLEEAEWTQRNLKISIRNIRLPNAFSDASSYGSFDVQIRKMSDSDAAVEPIESYVGVNLNPASPNYIASRIGDQHAVWNDAEKRYRYFGSHPNQSKYIRMEMATAVDEGSITEELVPFGFFGAPKPPAATIEGEGTAGGADASWIQDAASSAFVAGGGATVRGTGILSNLPDTLITAFLEWPSPKLVLSASSLSSLSEPADRYFGVDISRQGSALFDPSLYDITKARTKALSNGNWDKTGDMVDSVIFSLDDVSASADVPSEYIFDAGSRAGALSVTATGSDGAGSSAGRILDAGYDKFTMVMYGGFDGLEVKEMEPLINNRAAGSGLTAIIGATKEASYVKNTLMRAIDTVADAELVDMNLLVMPGVTNTGITDHMINTCDRRRDSMAIIDIPNAYTARHESATASESSRNNVGSGNTVSAAVNAVKQKGYNSSYAACYYPWVQINAPVSGLTTWCPPSVVALGAMAYGQATQAVWFAPAGFTRGGLSEGRGGLPVVAVSQRLSSKERDSLYEVNINPIAQFPAEGIVIFGQKTLQATPSALDRINVRRLMIFIKKRISRISSTLLFDPNVSATWSRFTSQVGPFLDSIKTGFGIEDFKVILDQTTTTADLIDRNVMYAKIYIKPTKAVEFIAIDFVITGQGASFDD